MMISNRDALAILERETGIVIPAYFSQQIDPAVGHALLRDTVHMFSREVVDPTAICLSVDGAGPAASIASKIAAEYGVRLVQSERNRGKLSAVANGMRALLEDDRWRYLATVDQDGDHFANELLNFVRCAEHVTQQVNTDRILVLGSRLTRHRPLGFLRGEQEELANRLLLDALTYTAAINGKPLVWQYANGLEEAPDFHSGYKFFSRTTAAAVFLPEPPLAGCDEAACYRHACEAVMTVEALHSGAIMAAVSRRTFDEQPISIFASINRARLAADMIIWPCKRLNIPGHFVEQWLTNHLHRLLLGTMAPQGRDELIAIRNLVLQAFDCSTPTQVNDQLPRALFL